MTPIYIFVKYI